MKRYYRLWTDGHERDVISVDASNEDERVESAILCGWQLYPRSSEIRVCVDLIEEGKTWLIEQSDKHLKEWTASKKGQKFRKALNRSVKGDVSPFQHGYEQPQWMKEAWDALYKRDVERFEAIKGQND